MSEDSTAATMQARMFAGLTAFSVIAAIVYGLKSREPAGTTLLLLTGGLTGLCGLYISWNRPARTAHHSGADGADCADGAAGNDEVDEQWFPHASPWPFAIAVSIVLAGNAMLLGVWLLLPGAILLAASIGGFAAQSRHRS